MRRTDLEATLEAHGWVYLKTIEGYRVWRHPHRSIVVAVTDTDIIDSKNAAGILALLER